MCNRLNSSQNAKLKANKQLLKDKQQLLAEKKQERKLRVAANQQQALPADTCLMSDFDKSLNKEQSSPGRESSIMRTPPTSVRQEHLPSSASRKRHSSIFEVKTRQLVEEESKTFRVLHSRRLEFDSVDEDATTESKPLQVDRHCHTNTQLQAKCSTGDTCLIVMLQISVV